MDSSISTKVKIQTNVKFNQFSAFIDGGALYLRTPTILLEIYGNTEFTRGSAKNGGCVYMSSTTTSVTTKIEDSLFSIIKASHRGSFLYMDGDVYPAIVF